MRPAIRDITHSLAFDGNSARFGKATAVPFANATQVTICGWMKCSPTTTARMLLESSTNAGLVNGFYFCQNSANGVSGTYAINFFVDDITNSRSSSIVSTLPALTSRRWVRFCLVIDQTKVSRQTAMYFDGVENSSVNTDQQCLSGIATNDLYFGARSTGSLPMMDGNLIVNRITTGKAFTAAEALSEYLTGNYPAGGTVLANYDWTPNNSMTAITDNGTGAKNIALTSPSWSADTPMRARPEVRDIPYSLALAGAQYGVASAVPFNSTKQLTILCWVKMVPFPRYYVLLSTSANELLVDGFGLYVNPSSLSVPNTQLAFAAYDHTHTLTSSIYSNSPLNAPPGTWVRLCLTMDQTIGSRQCNMYINGVQQSNWLQDSNGTSGVATNDLYVVSRGGGAAAPGGNIILDSIITGKVYTPAEAEAEYITARRPSGGTLLLDYRWNEGSGTTVTDYGTAGKNITLTSPIWTNDSPSHARLGDIDLGIAGQELIVRADDPGIVLIGGAVASWPDYRRYQNRALTQATSTKRPVMTRGANGRPGVLFDGVDDYLTITGLTLPQPCTVLLVYKHVALGATGVHDIVFDGASQFSTWYAAWNLPASYMQSSGGGQIVLTPRVVANGAYAYALFQFNGASSLVRENGVQIGTGNIGATAANGFTIGASGGSGLRSTNILVMEARVLSTVPTAAEIARWEAYVKARYGL